MAKETTAQTEVSQESAELIDEIVGQGAEDVQPETDEAEPEADQAQEDLVQLGQSEHKVGKAESEKLAELGWDLENDFNEASEEDILEILQKDVKKETSADEQTGFVITKEIAEKVGGFAKNFVGKSVEDVFEMVKANDSEITRLRNEKTELEKKLKENPKNDNNREDSSADVSLDNFSFDSFKKLAGVNDSTVKDFIDLDGDQMMKGLQGLVKLVQNETRKEYDKKFEEFQPLVEQTRQQKAAEAEKQLMSQIQSGLPKEVDAKKVLDIWVQNVGSKLSKEVIKSFQSDPSLFVETIKTFGEKLYYQNVASKNAEELKQITKTKKANDLKKLIANASRNTPSKEYNPVPRTPGSYTGDADTDKLIEEVIAIQ